MSVHMFLHALVVLFLLQYFSNVSAFNGRCPAGWTFFDHSCYLLNKTPQRSFPSALQTCVTLGASLVSISSAMENEMIHKTLAEGSSFWIGLNDIQQESVFQWTDGTQFRYSWNDTDQDYEDYLGSGYTPCPCCRPPTTDRLGKSPIYTYCHDAELDFSRWSTEEPNNAGNRKNEDCVHLTSAGNWNDNNCGSVMDYMCEKEANEEGTSNETTITCPHSFETVFELGASKIKTVTWSEPAYLADSLASNVQRSHSPGAEFRVGVTWVNYTFVDAYNNMATCNFSITVLEVDTTSPTIVSCPSDVTVTKVTNVPLRVSWGPPSATDLSESVTMESQSHFPGDEFPFGVNNVTYKFTDDSGNEAFCFFKIYVFEVNNPMESLVNSETYEAHDSVNNQFRGTNDKVPNQIAGLYIILVFIGLILALLLLFVIKIFRTKSDSGIGKLSYARMNGDAEVDIGM